MPNRWIRESCRTSKNLARVSDRAERLFWRLTTCADDYGRFLADPEVIKGQCFAYRDKYKTSFVNQDLLDLVIHKLVRLYTVKDRQYGLFITWEEHQGKPRAVKSKYPDIPEQSEILHTDVHNSLQVHTIVPVPPNSDSKTISSLSPNGKGESERKGKRAHPIPEELGLTPEEREQWAKFGLNPSVELAKMKDHFRANGKCYVDWEATKRNWMRRAIEMKETRP